MVATGKRGGTYANEAQKKMASIWRSKAWKKRIDELVALHPRCEYCNGRSQTVNHRKDGYYEGYELCRREEVDVVCNGCNEYWKEYKQKRQRLYDDCTECSAMIFVGRKVCFNCGAKTATKKLDVSPAKRAQLEGILGRCPAVQMGDKWKDVWCYGDVVVTGFEEQSDLPWPLVKTDRGEVGLPAFTFADRAVAGAGLSWQAAMGWSEKGLDEPAEVRTLESDHALAPGRKPNAKKRTTPSRTT